MRLTSLHCGTITSTMGDPPDPLQLPIMAFVIETGGEVVLFDTGMHPHVRTHPIDYWGRIAKRRLVPDLPEGADVVSRLAEAGYGPQDVTVVINSHLHNDHAGMNRFFPHSRIVVRRREWDYAITQMDADSSGFVRNDFFDEGAPPEFIEYDDECDLFGTGDLVLVSTPGHTPGHQSAKIRFGSGSTHVLTGDAVYAYDDIALRRPPGVTTDREAAIASIDRLADLEADGARIHVCHDAGHWAHVQPTAVVHEEPTTS
ncbi:N-acyl homoserine lactonase family protein [Cumulibacter soli]|uniref:N-acyl homoserine lactonase family protein n=1 Tax=Cumulibacter soli TaxID=2546344 RepID=UPI00106825CA|nr:N-acyl homoserine lactonase family protein [Cumulibacter soli]